jgi:hypothetical protein
MAKSILPLLNELFDEIPVQKIDADVRALTLRVLDVDVEELSTKHRQRHLKSAFSILKLVSAIRDASQHEKLVKRLEKILDMTKRGLDFKSDLEEAISEMNLLISRINKNI